MVPLAISTTDATARNLAVKRERKTIQAWRFAAHWRE
jgi:hypothetical protein